MVDMNTREARLAVLAGIRVWDEVTEEEMVGDKLSSYVCPMLASHRVVVEAVT